MKEEESGALFRRLLSVMATLRAPGGCPWDREQTIESLRTYITEESYELVDAIGRGEYGDICEECGDVLLQVIFVAQIASETGRFSIEDVLAGLVEKLVRRHPHVFAGSDARTSADVLQNWEEIKTREKQRRKKDPSLLAGVPDGLPPLAKSFRIQAKAAHVGFDWEKGDFAPLYGKVEEEILELKDAQSSEQLDCVEDEVGDLLFAVVNLARHLGVNPDSALSRANRKFTGRFEFVEGQVTESGRPWKSFTLDELETFWQEAKGACRLSACTDGDDMSMGGNDHEQ
ncbi:MAG TPA: nucleoside triphosphate pyrophosphohydrolase [Synergistaceae bacterium]|nr:nucleoside triphosphate pyrophosphohydrolase [Synergistaceae bacterium]